MTATSKPLVLIGHSGSGKSTSLQLLGMACSADMDFKYGNSPSPSLASALAWLTSATIVNRVVALSNHEEMLRALASAKSSGQYKSQFSAWRFTYLYVPEAQLRKQLALPTAGSVTRPLPTQQYILAHYKRFDRLFRDLQDKIISCAGQCSTDIATKLKTLAPL